MSDLYLLDLCLMIAVVSAFVTYVWLSRAWKAEVEAAKVKVSEAELARRVSEYKNEILIRELKQAIGETRFLISELGLSVDKEGGVHARDGSIIYRSKERHHE